MYATENVEACVYSDTEHSEYDPYRRRAKLFAVAAVTPAPAPHDAHWDDATALATASRSSQENCRESLPGRSYGEGRRPGRSPI
jgi:hypothetical protein